MAPRNLKPYEKHPKVYQVQIVAGGPPKEVLQHIPRPPETAPRKVQNDWMRAVKTLWPGTVFRIAVYEAFTLAPEIGKARI